MLLGVNVQLFIWVEDKIFRIFLFPPPETLSPHFLHLNQKLGIYFSNFSYYKFGKLFKKHVPKFIFKAKKIRKICSELFNQGQNRREKFNKSPLGIQPIEPNNLHWKYNPKIIYPFSVRKNDTSSSSLYSEPVS
jgi:hypothetical protein